MVAAQKRLSRCRKASQEECSSEGKGAGALDCYTGHVGAGDLLAICSWALVRNQMWVGGGEGQPDN